VTEWLFSGTEILVWHQIVFLLVTLALWGAMCHLVGAYHRKATELEIRLEGVKRVRELLRAREDALLAKAQTLRHKERALNVLALEAGFEARDEAR
jgi:hypothetical protein